jgi:hypothetical protein
MNQIFSKRSFLLDQCTTHIKNKNFKKQIGLIFGLMGTTFVAIIAVYINN